MTEDLFRESNKMKDLNQIAKVSTLLRSDFSMYFKYRK